MNRVIHFEIHSTDPDRAARFYGKVFGWRTKEWLIPGVQLRDEHRYWTVTTGEGECGINGGLVFRKGPVPAPGQDANAYVCTIGVASLDESMARAMEAGASLKVPKMPIPGVGWLAYFTDPDGNTFGLMQDDPGAR
jgi:predicted enzyme related to lactoylglutathione lyase